MNVIGLAVNELQAMTFRDPGPTDSTSKRKLAGFDWKAMRFATDTMTVKELRVHCEHAMPHGTEIDDDRSPLYRLYLVMDLERELAQIAYCEAAQIPESDGGVTFAHRGEVVRLLFDEYAALGITAGKKTSRQWVQSIEAQARIQARPFARDDRYRS